MTKALKKLILMSLLLFLGCSNVARAEVKVYQYDGKLPFVQMMLNMMVAMGILDRLPTNSVYGGRGFASSGYPGSFPGTFSGSPLSALSNPYARALALRGLTTGGMPWGGASYLNNPYLQNLYGGDSLQSSPFSSSPWINSPWSPQGLSGADWGAPDWGVRPLDQYAYYAPYGPSAWSADDLSGWVNEPWETSSWNPKADNTRQEAQSQVNNQARNGTQQAPGSAQTHSASSQNSAMPPLIQNFNYNVPPQAPIANQSPQNAYANQSQDTNWLPLKPDNRYRKPSPLSKLAPPTRSAEAQQRPTGLNEFSGMQQQANPRASQQASQQAGQQAPQQARQSRKAKAPPCVTVGCGMAKPNLNGLWVAQNGEMLGVKDQRYLWSDGDSRYLTGQLKVQNEYLLANIDGHDKLMRFKYKLANGHLVTLQPDGTIREFMRMPVNQLRR